MELKKRVNIKTREKKGTILRHKNLVIGGKTTVAGTSSTKSTPATAVTPVRVHVTLVRL